jgi:hypothetical protein
VRELWPVGTRLTQQVVAAREVRAQAAAVS